MLKKYFLDIMSKDAPGLYLCEVPTGIGKSYQAAQAMREYAKTTKKKIIYLTTLVKNVYEEAEELRSAYGDDDAFRRDVLIIPSNKKQIIDKIREVTIPNDILNMLPNYEELKKSVRHFEAATNSNQEIKSFWENKLIEEEQKFRSHIKKILEKIPKENRLKMIKEDKKYQWIGELYPAVFTDEKKILLMTVTKFLYKNSVIIRPSYDFIHSDFIKGSVIFLDEFDDSKTSILSYILDSAYKTEEDYLTVFHQLYTNMNESFFDSIVRESLHKIDTPKDGKAGRYESLKKEAEAIEKDFHLELNYKTIGDSDECKPKFLFFDGNIISSADDGRPIRGEYNKENNQIQLFYADKEKQNDTSLINLKDLLDRLHKFFYRFRLFALEWAKEYAMQVNQIRQNNSIYFEEDDALSTLLGCFRLTEKQKDFFFNEMNKSKEIVEEESGSFYEKGFEYFRFENSDKHLHKTDIMYVGVHETPEKVLCYLAQKATVIGLSASAEFQSPLCNYNLLYLKDTLGEDKFSETGKDLISNIKQELQRRYKPYENSEIQIHPLMIPNRIFDFNLPFSDPVNSGEKDFFRNKEKKKVFFDIMEKVSEDYCKHRYAAIVRVMQEFFATPQIKSLLCLESILAKNNDNKWDKEMLKELFKEIREEYGMEKEDAVIKFLSSENFEEDKKELNELLRRNKKVMVISAYQTLGAGQNLHYDVPSTDGLVELDIPSPSLKKDFDAIYLGQITNIITNFNPDDLFNPKKNELEKMKYITKIKELQEQGSISQEQSIEKIKKILDNKMPRQDYENREAKVCVSRTVLQAIGRICRARYKNPNIYIFVHEKTVKRLDLSCFNRRKGLIPPELSMIPFKEWRDNHTRMDGRPDTIYHNFSRWTSAWEDKLKEMMGGNHGFTEANKTKWGKIRDFILRHPTSNENRPLEGIPLYIKRDTPFNHYLFRAKKDFRSNKEFYSTEFDFSHDGKEGWSFVSEEDSKLPDILKYPGMRQHFKEIAYAISFEKDEYVLNPVLYRNVYKGALGETAGKFILEDAIPTLRIAPIENVKHFEKFDFMLPDYEGVYIDFKNWNENTMDKDRDEELDHIQKKMFTIGASLVFIINITTKDTTKYHVQEFSGKGIIVIPELIDSNGQLVKESIDKIVSTLQKYKQEGSKDEHNK